MGLLLTATGGVIVWIVLYSVGAKGFDALMLALFMVAVALAVRALPDRRNRR